MVACRFKRSESTNFCCPVNAVVTAIALPFVAVAKKRVVVFDPAGRLNVDLAAALDRAHVAADFVADSGVLAAACDSNTLLILAPAGAADLPKDLPATRWIIADGKDPARVAGAAAECQAQGVMLAPVVPEVLAAVCSVDVVSPEIDLARARSLVATSLIDFTNAPADVLHALANAFASHDCIVWWRDGETMAPTSARPAPDAEYRPIVAAAARVSAAFGGAVICAQPRCTVIAEALRPNATEVSGLVAIVVDHPRRSSAGERSDLRAIAARLTRELSFLSSHRRLAVEGERLLASSLHDPLTGALTRAAFEQAVTHEIAGATRRQESLTLIVLDIVGLRKINLTSGHRAGDEVLAQLAARVRACVRGNDPMGRMGGDELGVLLVGSNDAQGTLVARKILRKLSAEPFVIEGTALEVSVRAVLTELGKGERSGEAAFARCYTSLRHAPPGDVIVMPPDEHVADGEAQAESALTAGTIVGGTYRVLHELSRGAMGVVYRGEDLGLGRAVAIKVLRSDLANDRELVARFRNEAGLLASLHHNNLVQVYALGEHAGDVYFVMELVEGQPLSEVIRSTVEHSEWFPTAAVAQVSLEIADALDAMHARGLIHRDVKPANILLDRDRDRAVLVDVGVAAKAGDQREAAGTPGFAAPESFLETQDSAQTDVYGLAATVYCMLTGRPPFGSGPAVQVIHRQLYDPLAPPSLHRPHLSAAVDAVLAKGLEPSPKKRWASASTFAMALARALERLPQYESAPRIDSPEEVSPQVEAVMAPTAALSVDDIGRVATSLPPTSSDPGIIGMVRGAHFRLLSKLLAHHLGESAVNRLSAEKPTWAPLLAQGLPPMSWQELGLFVEMLAHVTQLLPQVGVPRQVGRNVIAATFARMFGAEPASLPIETVLTAMPTFWPRYHDWGGINVYLDECKADIILDGFAGSPLVCEMVGAQFERIAELAGAVDVAVDHITCTTHTADACRYRLVWSMAAAAHEA